MAMANLLSVTVSIAALTKGMLILIFFGQLGAGAGIAGQYLRIAWHDENIVKCEAFE